VLRPYEDGIGGSRVGYLPRIVPETVTGKCDREQEQRDGTDHRELINRTPWIEGFVQITQLITLSECQGVREMFPGIKVFVHLEHHEVIEKKGGKEEREKCRQNESCWE
jgi:hypothetical protein